MKHEMIFGPFQETSLTAITLNPESNCTQREKNHSLFHWNSFMTYPELRRQTWMLCEKAASIIIGISMDQEFWTGFTQFTPLSEKPPEGHMWSGGRLTKRQATSRPDHLWPELWRGMSKNAKLKEKQKWAIEKQKLENARRLRGIYFIDPEDMEFKEIIFQKKKKTQEENWEHQWLQPCLARLARKASMKRPLARLMISSLSLRASWKPVNPQGCVWKKLYRNIMRTISQEKETIHYSITIWYTDFSMPQAMKIPAAKAAVSG